MKSTIITAAAALLSLTGHVSAQFNIQSAPFSLILLSEDASLNGVPLGACHEGAAIEGLCAGGVTATQFTFNTSTDEFIGDVNGGAPGYLTYELQGGNFNVSEPMNLLFDPVSNVALPLFEPDETGTEVAFDVNGLMNIQGFIDDTTDPATVGNVFPYYRWYVCTTVNEGYTYETLAWAVGKYPPENPTCCPVNVLRTFL